MEVDEALTGPVEQLLPIGGAWPVVGVAETAECHHLGAEQHRMSQQVVSVELT